MHRTCNAARGVYRGNLECIAGVRVGRFWILASVWGTNRNNVVHQIALLHIRDLKVSSDHFAARGPTPFSTKLRDGRDAEDVSIVLWKVGDGTHVDALLT